MLYIFVAIAIQFDLLIEFKILFDNYATLLNIFVGVRTIHNHTNHKLYLHDYLYGANVQDLLGRKSSSPS